MQIYNYLDVLYINSATYLHDEYLLGGGSGREGVSWGGGGGEREDIVQFFMCVNYVTA